MSKRITFSDEMRDEIYNRYNGRCAICGNCVKREKMTIDHKIPLSKGGSHHFSNLQLCCLRCNRAKQDMTMDNFLRRVCEICAHNQAQIRALARRGGRIMR